MKRKGLKIDWLRLALALAVLPVPAGPALAAEKQAVATWTYDEAAIAAEGIVGFRVKNGHNATVVDQIPASARTATFTFSTDDKTCHSFYLTAYSEDDETRPSNILTWCPPRKVFTGVGTFTLEFKD